MEIYVWAENGVSKIKFREVISSTELFVGYFFTNLAFIS